MKPFTLQWWLRVLVRTVIIFANTDKGGAKYQLLLKYKWITSRIINKYGEQDA